MPFVSSFFNFPLGNFLYFRNVQTPIIIVVIMKAIVIERNELNEVLETKYIANANTNTLMMLLLAAAIEEEINRFIPLKEAKKNQRIKQRELK